MTSRNRIEKVQLLLTEAQAPDTSPDAKLRLYASIQRLLCESDEDQPAGPKNGDDDEEKKSDNKSETCVVDKETTTVSTTIPPSASLAQDCSPSATASDTNVSDTTASDTKTVIYIAQEERDVILERENKPLYEQIQTSFNITNANDQIAGDVNEESSSKTCEPTYVWQVTIHSLVDNRSPMTVVFASQDEAKQYVNACKQGMYLFCDSTPPFVTFSIVRHSVFATAESAKNSAENNGWK